MTNGRHNQKTLSFVKACTAYVHITIPTLDNVDMQNKLFLLAAQTSLLNGLVGETESLLQSILVTMDERFTADAKKLTAAGQKIETHYVNNLYKMGELLQSLCGFLVIVPSNPEGSYFQMVEGILNFLKKDEWGQSPDAYIVQVRVLDSVVRYLASQTQDTLPYRIANVESNDQIFIGDENF